MHVEEGDDVEAGQLLAVTDTATVMEAFVKEAEAIVLFPGGFGTLDECFEVLTLLQTGKQTPLPVVMVESPETGYFKDLVRFIDERVLSNRLISEQDRSLYRVVKGPVEACEDRCDILAIDRAAAIHIVAHLVA